MSRRFRLFAIAVIALGIVAAFAAGGAGAWAWTTDGVHPFFKFLLPLLTGWLVFALVRLALDLRYAARAGIDDWPNPLAALLAAPSRPADAVVRGVWPDAESCQQLHLPPEPGTPWYFHRSRRRIALRIAQRDGCHRLVVAPARSALHAVAAHSSLQTTNQPGPSPGA